MKNRYLITILASLTLLFGLTAFAPRNEQGITEDILSHTNKFRKSHRLDGLVMRSELNAIAQKHSERMAKGRVGFGHSGFNSRYKQACQSIKGVSTIAENVAYGVRTGKDAVNLWKKSSGHRKNMLGKYRYIGIGVAKDRRGVIYYTQIFAN